MTDQPNKTLLSDRKRWRIGIERIDELGDGELDKLYCIFCLSELLCVAPDVA